MEEDDFVRNIAIVGLGLIGGSYAMALKRLNSYRIIGIDRDGKVLEKAICKGVIDEGSIFPEYVLYKSDMVIIALYPDDAIEFIKENALRFKPGAIVTDTCGIKQAIINSARESLPDVVEFVGGHPMAGNEFQGFDAASPELFRDTNYIITPHEKNSERGISAVEKLAAQIGCKSIARIGAEAHDRIISYTSQLPHIVAVLLANLVMDEKEIGLFTGRSFRDATRVAALNKELWTQIFRMNISNIIDRIEDMENILEKMKNAVSSHDETDLRVLFDNAIKGKREIG